MTSSWSSEGGQQWSPSGHLLFQCGLEISSVVSTAFVYSDYTKAIPGLFPAPWWKAKAVRANRWLLKALSVFCMASKVDKVRINPWQVASRVRDLDGHQDGCLTSHWQGIVSLLCLRLGRACLLPADPFSIQQPE